MAGVDALGQQGGSLVHGAQQGGKPAINSWVSWFLFGLGWISQLLLGLSWIPFGPTAQKVLVFFAIPFLLCWWAAAVLGSGDVLNASQRHASRSNVIMALIGSGLAAVRILVFMYNHIPSLSSLVTVAAIFAAVHFYSKSQGVTPAVGTPAAEPSSSVAATSPAVASEGPPAAEGSEMVTANSGNTEGNSIQETH